MCSAEETVTLQLKGHHQFQFAGYYAALEKGYYRDAGLNVKILEGDPDIDVADEVESGHADFGVGNSSVLVDACARRQYCRIGRYFQHSPDVILVTQRSGINNLEALQNRKLMDAADCDDIMAMLKSAGVDYAKIPRVKNNGDPLDLLNGKADAMFANVQTSYELARRGVPYKEFSPRSAGIDFMETTLLPVIRKSLIIPNS